MPIKREKDENEQKMDNFIISNVRKTEKGKFDHRNSTIAKRSVVSERRSVSVSYTLVIEKLNF